MKPAIISSLLLLLSLSFAAAGPIYYIGTGIGVIGAELLSDVWGKLTEVYYDRVCNSCEEQQWTLEKNPSIPNGWFIRSVLYPNLVWDAKDDKVTVDNLVILYQQKSTLLETKNQRWEITANNQFSIIKDSNFVATVYRPWEHGPTGDAEVRLALKNSQSTNQKFYLVDKSNLTYISVLVVPAKLGNAIVVSFESPIGGPQSEYFPEGSNSKYFYVAKGTTVVISDYETDAIKYNGTFTSDAVIEVAVPMQNQFYLDLESNWVGSNGETVTIYLNTEYQNSLTGQGQYADGSVFSIVGMFEVDGQVGFTWSPSTCYGQVSESGLEMSGICYSQDNTQVPWSFTKVEDEES